MSSKKAKQPRTCLVLVLDRYGDRRIAVPMEMPEAKNSTGAAWMKGVVEKAHCKTELALACRAA